MRRQQRPRGATTREAVVDAALAIADTVGVDALTIRAVAQRVGAPPMSLYTHFANKEELIDLMYSEVASRMFADGGNPTWQAEISSLCHQVRALILAHPRWTPLLSRAAPPLSIPVRERVLKLMIADGMTPEAAFRGFSSAMIMAQGLTLVELTLRDRDGTSSITKRFDRLQRRLQETSSQGDEMATRSAFAKVRTFDLSQNFSITVRHVIAGIEARG